MAWFLYLNGFHDLECLKHLTEVLPHASDPPATRRAIDHLRQELGLIPPKAKSAMPLARTASGDSRQARLQRARHLFWSGSGDAARKALEAMIEEQPTEAALRWELSKVLVAQQDYAAAAEQLAIARKHQPQEPEIILAQAQAEALCEERGKALGLLENLNLEDPAPLHLARAQAHHYSGKFTAAAQEYRQVLASRPHHEVAAHGLAECSLRNHSIPEANDILRNWTSAPQSIDWSQRFALEHELTANRVSTGAGYFRNSTEYESFSLGVDLQMRPRTDLDTSLSATYGWFDQSGFDSIERSTVQVAMRHQDTETWAIYGSLGVNDYSNDWTSVVGGLGVMFRPHASLELNLSAAHIDVVDSEPPLGMSVYDLGSTIGAVGGKASMDSLALSAMWQATDRIDVFGKYRIATLDDDNTLTDAYASISYLMFRDPMLRLGYGIAHLSTEDPSPVYTEGTASAPWYYDPRSLTVHNLYFEYSQQLGDRIHWGTEAHLYLQPDHDTTGVGLFGHVRYAFDADRSLRFDARYYTQNRGRDRNHGGSGHYNAINLVLIYEHRF